MTSLKVIVHDFLIGLSIPEPASNLIIVLMMVMIWIIAGMCARRLVKRLLNRALKVNKNGPRGVTIGKMSSSLSKYFIWFIVTMGILRELNVDLTPFIASAGVIGLALGFGAQAIVKDFIRGFFIIFEESFNVDDVVEIDGFKGTILSLGLRITKIQNWKGEVKIINNGEITSIINFSRADSIAIVEFGVAYDTDLLKLQSLMPDFAKATYDKYTEILDTPTFSGIIKLSDSSIDMRLIAKTVTMKHFQIERDIRRDLVLFLRTNDIEIPFPQVVIHNVQD
jgi:small conductance mechanosensitive channel